MTSYTRYCKTCHARTEHRIINGEYVCIEHPQEREVLAEKRHPDDK